MSKQPATVSGVLLDADALVALSKIDDVHHAAAVQMYQQLKNQHIQLYVSPFTIPEVATVLSHKVSQHAAKQFLRTIRAVVLPELQLSSTTSADEWFIQQPESKTSYPDCYNLALLQEKHELIQAVFSFDHIYEANGFSRIQLLF